MVLPDKVLERTRVNMAFFLVWSALVSRSKRVLVSGVPLSFNVGRLS